MSIDLSNYSEIYTATFVKIDIPDFEVLRFSNHYKTYQMVESDGNTYAYANLGELMSVSDSTSSVRINPEQITITISGVPNNNVANFTEQAVKGSRVEVRTIYLNGSDYSLISTPIIKFKGIVDNYFVSEEYPDDGKSDQSTCYIGLVCSTLFDMYQNKQSGRRTNPFDQKTYFPTDLSMDRVPTVTGSNFNFGAPR